MEFTKNTKYHDLVWCYEICKEYLKCHDLNDIFLMRLTKSRTDKRNVDLFGVGGLSLGRPKTRYTAESRFVDSSSDRAD